MITFDIKEGADPILEVGDLVIECHPKNNRVSSRSGIDEDNVYGLYLVLSREVASTYTIYSVFSLSYNCISNSGMHPGLSGKTLSGNDWSNRGGLRFARLQDICNMNLE